LASVR